MKERKNKREWREANKDICGKRNHKLKKETSWVIETKAFYRYLTTINDDTQDTNIIYIKKKKIIENN